MKKIVKARLVKADTGSDLLKAVQRAAKLVTRGTRYEAHIQKPTKNGEFAVVTMSFKTESPKYPSRKREQLYPTLIFYMSQSNGKTSLQTIKHPALDPKKRVEQNFHVKNLVREIQTNMVKHGFDATTY